MPAAGPPSAVQPAVEASLPGVHREDLRLVPAAVAAWGGAAAGVGVPPAVALWAALGGLLLAALLLVGPVLVRPVGRAPVRRVPVASVRVGPARGPVAARAAPGRAGPGAGLGRPGPRPREHRPGAAGARAALALAAVAAAAALASAGVRTAGTSGGLLPDLVERRAVVEVAVRVSADPSPVAPAAHGPSGSGGAGASSPERWVVRVRALEVAGRGAVGGARGGLLLVGGRQVAELGRDEEVTVVGRLVPTEPGEDVVALLRVQGPLRAVRPPTGWRGAAAHLRAGLRTAVEPLPADPRGLLPGLVVGDTTALPTDLEDAMRTAGLAHLTAVSGGNTAVLVAAAAGGAALLGARRLARAAVAGAALTAFVAVAGPEPSVLRAGVMAAAALVGLLAARPGRGVPPLAAAVVVLVVLDPSTSRSVGFALSVLGTGALLLLARPWAAGLARVVPERAAVVVAVPLAAQAVCAPVLLLLDPRVSLVAVPANVLAAPAVAPATVLGVLALAVAPLSPPLAHVLVVPAGWAAGWVAAVARTAASVPAATVPWPGGWAGAALLAGVLLTALVVLPALLRGVAAAVRARPRDPAGARGLGAAVVGAGPRPRRPARGGPDVPAGRPGGAGRDRRQVLALVAAACLVTGLALAPPVRARLGGASWPPPDWLAVQCDVGQGAALVVRSGPGAAVVVDVGPDPALVDGCLDRLGVERVDLLVLTHFHADHVDGLPGALAGREVERALTSPLPVPDAAAGRVAQQLADAGVPSSVGVAGEQGTAGEVRWRVLAPGAGASPGPSAAGGVRGAAGGGGAAGGEDDGANDASVVVVLEAPDGRVTALGDLGAEAQAALRRATSTDAGAWPVDVLGVAHHGSSDQDPGLAALADPRAALVGVGENTYGHPTARALELAGAGGAVVACTTATGDVAVSGRPDALMLTARRALRDGATC
ncbi:ComEC/Rec2 family competence protein [uncultured Pseudokineococcus sp.]|uniref:ComEC/Rec2 family competence protein n=1 Tax=uncultured Pseudokineococcus sp. TaxID=1642928 RepID=UPI002638E8EF|nr:ComEC/Rec2 family competence protein [uncultured Pseudokineococcus sp.]